MRKIVAKTKAYIGKHKLKNRIIIPPIVRCKATEEGFVTDELIESYVGHAKSGASLLIVEASTVQKNGRILKGELGIFSDEHIPGLKKLATAIKNEDVKVIIQLVHAGRMGCDGDLVAPSAIPFEDRETPRELTIQEIEEIEESFVAASLRAIQAGFDGVEVHCAHGYLLSQFISPLSNKRMDEYGGSSERRAKLLISIVKNIRKEIRNYKIISVRLGARDAGFSGGLKVGDAKLISIWLEQAGVNLIDVSQNIIASRLGGSKPREPMAFAGLSKEIKQVVNIPVAVAGGIRTKEHVEEILESNSADLVAVCRAVLADPKFPAKVLGINPDPIIPCLVCKSCGHFIEGCPPRPHKA